MIGTTTYRYDVAAHWPPASDLDAAAVATERVWAAVRYPALLDAISSTRLRFPLGAEDRHVDLPHIHPGLTFFGGINGEGPCAVQFDTPTIARAAVVSGFHITDSTSTWDPARAVGEAAAAIDAAVVENVLAILRLAATDRIQPGANASEPLKLAWRTADEPSAAGVVWLDDFVDHDRPPDPADETFTVYADDIVTVTWGGILTTSWEDYQDTNFVGRVEWNMFVMPRHPIQHHPRKGTTHGTS